MNRYGPEGEYPLGSPEVAVISIATQFTGLATPNTVAGYESAVSVIETQHKRVAPKIPPIELRRLITKDTAFITRHGNSFVKALDQDDSAAAIRTTHIIYACGEMDYQDNLGGDAARLSLLVHRLLYSRIWERHWDRDPMLQTEGLNMDADIAAAQKRRDFHEEIFLERSLIHTVALNGTLGPEAKDEFDPYALVSPE